MDHIYIWRIHEKYARYWTKESLEEPAEFGPLYDKALIYLKQRNNPLELPEWNPPILIEHREKGRPGKKGDMHSTWGGYGHLLSQNMVDQIGDVLEKYGVLFPCEVEDREDKLYRYWVTNEIPFECLDLERSNFDKSKRDETIKAMLVRKVVFKDDCFDGSMIFRIADEINRSCFVTQEFIELVKKHRLKGFMFEKEYLGKEKPVLVG